MRHTSTSTSCATSSDCAWSRSTARTTPSTGTLLASGGLFGIVYGLVRGPVDGWTGSVVLTA
ncbi:hypothetical protein, partial [Streptomyces anthocyanicus]|uniref:hypothetical protein n=1 Tax=Streptomyces anthocyanicus TaxID=68174 RepID=UPI0033FE9FFB